MVVIIPTALPGCVHLQPRIFDDDRGRFVKVFHEPDFSALGLVTAFAEQYYSVSRPGVLRGMHFQLPPHDHAKLVFCTRGSVLDAVVDLRRDSPSFGKHAMVELSASQGNLLYIPRGFAHGFYVPAEESTLVYMVETVHSPTHDAGIRWDTCGIDWPESNPVLSERDRRFPSLKEFESPFRLDSGERP